MTPKGNDILAKYYEGILNQLRGEVDFINEVFEHQGLKGEGNEAAIRNLLQKFIPKKYGVGSGLVIDRDGQVSKQCDIVIYDNQNYPEILSLSPVHIYPVDLVYATIEVKTTVDSTKARQAIENIKSVRGLNYIKEQFRGQPSDPFDEVGPDTVFAETRSTTPPIGIVFCYNSDTLNYQTFSNWFMQGENEDVTHWPAGITCLDQGTILNPGHPTRTCILYPYVFNECFFTAEPEQIREINGKEWAERLGRLFPISIVNGGKFLIDQSKALLHFMLILSNTLLNKQLSPHINFITNYLTPELSLRLVIPGNDKDPIYRID